MTNRVLAAKRRKMRMRRGYLKPYSASLINGGHTYDKGAAAHFPVFAPHVSVDAIPPSLEWSGEREKVLSDKAKLERANKGGFWDNARKEQRVILLRSHRRELYLYHTHQGYGFELHERFAARIVVQRSIVYGSRENAMRAFSYKKIIYTITVSPE